MSTFNYDIYNNFQKNGVAYTEDNVKVHKIYVHSISKEITVSEIRLMFERFGSIFEIELLPDPLLDDYQTASIYYEHAESACSALNAAKRFEKFCIEPCFSWEQPNSSPQSQLNESLIANTSMSDDCWMHVCSLLDIRDQLMFALSCQHFEMIFVMSCKIKSLDMAILKKFTLWESKRLFELIGNSLKKFKLDERTNYSRILLPLIPEKARNLNTLASPGSMISVQELQRIVEQCQQLEELNLQGCFLTDDHILLLQQLPRLLKLDIADNAITGRHLYSLSQLQYLSLKQCVYVEDMHLIRCFQSLTQLRYLNLTSIDHDFGQEVYEAVSNNCIQLQEFHFNCNRSNSQYIICIAKLPELKSIRICEESGIDCALDFLETLSQIEPQRLEKLNIYASIVCDYINEIVKFKTLTHLSLFFFDSEQLPMLQQLSNLEFLQIDDGYYTDNAELQLLLILKNCRKMKVLSIQSCRITEHLIWRIIENKNDFKSANRQIQLYVFGTLITETILQNSDYLENKSWLKLYFEEKDFES